MNRPCLAAALAAAAIVLPAAPAAAQCASAWTAVTATPRPTARADHVSAYDAARGQVVLFGGYNGDRSTWLFNGSTWQQVATTGTRPAARGGAAMAYDPVRQLVVLHGGSDGSGNTFNDTWLWNGAAWTQGPSAGTLPSQRYDHSAAWDPSSQRVLIFGGNDGMGTNMNDAWGLNAAGWVRLSAGGAAGPAQPSARTMFGLASDTARGRVVLFGGSASGSLANDTWEWNGTAWSRVNITGPSGRRQLRIAFDSASARTVLFGGYDLNGTELADTWAYTGGAWTNLNLAGPPGRDGHSLAYHAGVGKVVLFGGNGAAGPLNDAWTLGSAGCPADTDCSGEVNANDVSVYINRWYADITNGTTVADFDHSGETNANDISSYINAWYAAIVNGGHC